ncbi:MAG TPA: arsenosugar biosynthesis radical SAM (seleno)protein ArsS [Planctomycetota bacterium]|nr:arsenosugar biosynthesis radical SAM (seleno)protein ArsS [Planctomycetota bacterium]
MRPPKVALTLARRGSPLADPTVQLARLAALDLRGPHGGDFERALAGLAPLRAIGIEVLQVNVGRVCNQTCAHCHVDAGPERTESMTCATAERVLAVLAASGIGVLDITGGAPELAAVFEPLVRGARALGRRVIDRCNLTVLTTAPLAHLPAFLAEHSVEVVASLPHPRKLATDRQRGEGVFEASLEGLRRLNAVGYGDPARGLSLTLVTNPVGAFLPAQQASLEAEWKRELLARHGIRFDRLIALTNMPISRFLEWLERSGNLHGYMQTLVDAYNPAAAAGVMCRTTLSVGWDGRLFDCDFNQMLELATADDAPRHIDDFYLARLERRAIRTARHCFGCTAGAGSSCGGRTA